MGWGLGAAGRDTHEVPRSPNTPAISCCMLPKLRLQDIHAGLDCVRATPERRADACARCQQERALLPRVCACGLVMPPSECLWSHFGARYGCRSVDSALKGSAPAMELRGLLDAIGAADIPSCWRKSLCYKAVEMAPRPATPASSTDETLVNYESITSVARSAGENIVAGLSLRLRRGATLRLPIGSGPRLACEAQSPIPRIDADCRYDEGARRRQPDCCLHRLTSRMEGWRFLR